MGDNNSASTVGELWELFELMYFMHLTQSLAHSKLLMLATRDHLVHDIDALIKGMGSRTKLKKLRT